MDKLDTYLKALPPVDENRLAGLEARVWQRIDASKAKMYFSGLPLWLKSLPVAAALLFGGVIGASAMPAQSDLEVFSTAPAYSVSNMMADCCAE